MNNSNHWIVCLDLSQMDDILIRYVEFLANTLQPEHIEFIHVLESGQFTDDIANLFPELGNKEELEGLIGRELQKKIGKQFDSVSSETSLSVLDGDPTNEIIQTIRKKQPDLLILGKKTGYAGEGVMASRIVKYVPNSVLFVPETSRHQLESVLVPTDFSIQSANAVTSVANLRKRLNRDITLITQHVFRYPAHYFPYFPTDKEKEKIRTHLEEKKERFVKEHDLTDDLSFVISMTNKEKKAQEIYNEVVRHQIDMIVLAAKGDKSLMSLLKEDFTDRMIHFSFGVPLLIQKNKKRHERYLTAFLSS
jgi:nucleotide-binding universal stress UspA family protein